MLTRMLFASGLILVIALGSIRAAEEADVAALGDLSSYKAIADAALKAVSDGDMKTAVDKMKEFEKAWDDGEATLKPKSANGWNIVDKKMDRVISLLEASKPDAAKCKTALEGFIALLAGKKK